MNRALIVALIALAVLLSMTAAFAWTHTRTGPLGAPGVKVMRYSLPAGAVYAAAVERLMGHVDYDLKVVDPLGNVIASGRTAGDETVSFDTSADGVYQIVVRANPVAGSNGEGKYVFTISGRENGDPVP